MDLDPEIIELCRTNKDIAALNLGSLDSEKLEIINEDAYKYLEDIRSKK